MADIPLPSKSEPASIAGHQPEFRESVIRSAISNGLLNDEQCVVAFVDEEGVRATIANLMDAFPDNFVHTFAAKANSMTRALEIVRDEGMGCEVASSGELRQAVRVGFAPDQIVYDEPAKTMQILRYVLDQGISLNIDNFQEYERILELLGGRVPASRIGFRINPQVGAGRIGAMSTATSTSKFGIALGDAGNRETLIRLYSAAPFLRTLHTHIGSQGCSTELMVEGIRAVVDLANDIRIAGGRVEVLDIGGGLPVNFDSDEVTPTFADYAAALRADVPELFTGEFTVKTEFGRSIFAKNGFIAARVEYTKESGGRRIAITHAGAQTATRTAFMPNLWAIRIGVYDSTGKHRCSDIVEQDVAGPCCFAGDMLAQKRELPLIEPGDYVALLDTGAYYFSNPFYYNSLPPTAVYGVRATKQADVQFETWRKQQSFEEMLPLLG